MLSTIASNPLAVPIDGSNGAGKTTLINNLARRYRGHRVPALAFSTGDLYRVIALVVLEAAKKEDRPIQDFSPEECVALAKARGVRIHNGAVHLGWMPVERARFRTPEMHAVTPLVSKHPEVRNLSDSLTAAQIDEFDGFVFYDGRGGGVDITPHSRVKLFLTANHLAVAKRTGRRPEDILSRDDIDTQQGGQRAAPDAVVIDTSEMSEQMVEDTVHSILVQHFAQLAVAS